MKKLNKVLLASSLLFALIGTTSVSAATNPVLGTASPFVILSSSYINTTAGTTLNGNLGYTSGPAVVPTINGTTNVNYSQAGTDQGTALTSLNSQSCTYSFPVGPINLATDTTHGAIGVYAPGVYCITGAASIGTAGITLNGNGTYIFRPTGAFTTVANSIVKVSGGASSCDIFWTPGQATTLGANTTFLGTDIDDSGITIGNTVNWSGRALSFGGTVSTDSDTINSACVVSVATVVSTSGSTLSIQSGIGGHRRDITALLATSATPTVVPKATSTPIFTPKLPNTGFAPENTNITFEVFLLAGLVLSLFALNTVKASK
jgi:hypothetical protein